jgi:hypothetical protein
MGYGEAAQRVTTDHKPSEAREQARIERQGGCVVVRVNESTMILIVILLLFQLTFVDVICYYVGSSILHPYV